MRKVPPALSGSNRAGFRHSCGSRRLHNIKISSNGLLKPACLQFDASVTGTPTTRVAFPSTCRPTSQQEPPPNAFVAKSPPYHARAPLMTCYNRPSERLKVERITRATKFLRGHHGEAVAVTFHTHYVGNPQPLCSRKDTRTRPASIFRWHFHVHVPGTGE